MESNSSSFLREIFISDNEDEQKLLAAAFGKTVKECLHEFIMNWFKKNCTYNTPECLIKSINSLYDPDNSIRMEMSFADSFSLNDGFIDALSKNKSVSVQHSEQRDTFSSRIPLNGRMFPMMTRPRYFDISLTIYPPLADETLHAWFMNLIQSQFDDKYRI